MMPMSFHELDELEALKEERKLAIEVSSFNSHLVLILKVYIWFSLRLLKFGINAIFQEKIPTQPPKMIQRDGSLLKKV